MRIPARNLKSRLRVARALKLEMTRCSGGKSAFAPCGDGGGGGGDDDDGGGGDNGGGGDGGGGGGDGGGDCGGSCEYPNYERRYCDETRSARAREMRQLVESVRAPRLADKRRSLCVGWLRSYSNSKLRRAYDEKARARAISTLTCQVQ